MVCFACLLCMLTCSVHVSSVFLSHVRVYAGRLASSRHRSLLLTRPHAVLEWHVLVQIVTPAGNPLEVFQRLDAQELWNAIMPCKLSRCCSVYAVARAPVSLYKISQPLCSEQLRRTGVPPQATASSVVQRTSWHAVGHGPHPAHPCAP
jgi:hypothetical protein